MLNKLHIWVCKSFVIRASVRYCTSSVVWGYTIQPLLPCNSCSGLWYVWSDLSSIALFSLQLFEVEKSRKTKKCSFINWLSSYSCWICRCFSPVGLWRRSEFPILTKPQNELLQGPFNNDPALPVNLITICKATGGAWGDNTLAELVNKTDNSFFMLPRILEHGRANV